MPQPPSMSSPAPVSAQPTTAPIRPANKMQVTGERERPTPSTQSSVDAFGLPSAPKQQGSASSGFTDSFTSKAFRPTSRFGRGLSQTNSGFGDSFDAGTSPQVNVQAATPSSIEKISAADLKIPQTSSPIATTSDPKSANAGGDQNFETRFPSMEVLSSGDSTSMSARQNLISPIASPPPNVSRPSMLGNMTGGDLKQPYQHLGLGSGTGSATGSGGQPQPRSTHVTGTAFSQAQQRQDQLTRSPSPIKAKTEYFETMSSSSRSQSQIPAPSPSLGGLKSPVDLMTGEENESMGVPLIQRSDSNLDQSSSGLGPRNGHGRTARPGESLDVVDSSDEEEGPETISADHREYTSINDGPSTQAPPGVPVTEESTDKGKSASLPPIDDLPSNLNRGDASSQSRPKSMYTLPSPLDSTHNRQSWSPEKSGSKLPLPDSSDAQGRPQHVRKGSINDMVSKFENLKPPLGTSPSTTRPTPTIATKPAQLKKPTLDTVRTEPGGGKLQSPILPTGRKGTIPTKPEKPVGLARSSGGSGTSVGVQSGPTPSGYGQGGRKYGETPRPDGYSKSSSGRSFPIVKSKPQISGTNPSPTDLKSSNDPQTRQATSSETSPSSMTSQPQKHNNPPQSPEKQQSVNSLVARWNQGEMTRKSAPAVKPKPVL